jgi:hypothetical protein
MDIDALDGLLVGNGIDRQLKLFIVPDQSNTQTSKIEKSKQSRHDEW